MQKNSKSNSLPSLCCSSTNLTSSNQTDKETKNDKKINKLEITTTTSTQSSSNTSDTCSSSSSSNSSSGTTQQTESEDCIKTFIEKLKMLEKANQLESILSPRISFRKFNQENNQILKPKRNTPILNKLPIEMSEQKDPVRVIKITEIIEINGDNQTSKSKTDNLKFNFSNTKLDACAPSKERSVWTKYIESSSLSRQQIKETKISESEIFKPVKQGFTIPIQTNRVKITDLAQNCKQLPIFIEKSQNSNSEVCLETNKGSENNNNQCKNAEIVLEIINGDKLSDKLNSNGVGLDANKPKKITIKITGRTRSTSTEAKKVDLNRNSAIKTSDSFTPINQSGFRFNSGNLMPKSFHSLTNDARITKAPKNETNNNNNTDYPQRFSEFTSLWKNDSDPQDETKFCLDKFKSYLNNFNELNRLGGNRSNSMPPKITKQTNTQPKEDEIGTKKNLNQNYNDAQDFYNFNTINEFNPYIQSSLNNSGDCLAKRTTFKSINKSSTLDKTSQDANEPVWTYREDLDSGFLSDSTKKTNKKSILTQNKPHLNLNSSNFRCGLFNKPPKVPKSPNLNRKIFSLISEQTQSSYDLNRKENFSSTFSLANDSSTKTDPVNSSPRPSSILTLNKKLTGDKLNSIDRNQSKYSNGFKTVSSYYNEFYSHQNEFIKQPNQNLGKYIDEEEFNLEDNEDEDVENKTIEHNDDTEADEDGELGYTEGLFNDTNDNNKTKFVNNFTTFLPIRDLKTSSSVEETSIMKSSLILNSPKTPKLNKRVNFADGYN